MQNELKSAIRFNDFVAYFGARGVLVMAWWMGAVHAGRIREEQTSFPFLQIVGAAGCGKSLLLNYLQKLNGQTPYSNFLGHSTPTGRVRTFASAGQRIVICEEQGELGQSIDWDELKPLFSSGTVSFRSGNGLSDEVTFRGALVITANQPLECSDAVASRMVTVDLSAHDAHTPRIRPEAIGNVEAAEASAFGTEIAQSGEWICSNLRNQARAYQGQLISKYGENLNRRTALNCAQMFVLLDLLSTLLSIPDALRIDAGHFIHDIAFHDTIPY